MCDTVTPHPGDVLGLRIPAGLRQVPAIVPSQGSPPASETPGPVTHAAIAPLAGAVEVSRVVPPSGNLWVAGQQIWLGPALSGRLVVLSAGLDRIHVRLDGHRFKTLPSRLDRTDIGRLLAAGARPAGQPQPQPASSVIELDRTVNASGTISLGGRVLSAGLPLAGQRVTLRLDGPVVHVLASGILARTIRCPIPEPDRERLRGARPAEPGRPRLPEPQIVKRRVSGRGAIMIGRQRIQVGLPHAGKTADVTIETDTYHIAVPDAVTVIAPRNASRDIKRHKASNYGPAGT
jgi:hypothetical protein